MRSKSILFVGTVLYTATPVLLQEKFNIADSINKFSVELLAAVNNECGGYLNVALSPLTIWTLLTIISEGAYDNTADQLNKALRLPQNKNSVRDSYQKLSRMLQVKSNEAEFETSSGIFASQQFPVKDKFANVAKQYYGTGITAVNFKDNHQEAAGVINKYVTKATRNRITDLVKPGQWQTPFNRSATQRDVFFDDKKNKIGEVNMMYQAYPFAFARIDNIRANVVELPYGYEEKYSMLVLLPRGAQTVTDMLNGLKKESITEILGILKTNQQTFIEEDIHVYMPKFKITSDFNMDVVLHNMGIKDIFDPQQANLLGIFPHYLFLSRVIHKAEIEVDEEGTVAAAAGGSIFLNRAPASSFKVNKPFVYFIIQKDSGTIIFAGKLSNPNTISQ